MKSERAYANLIDHCRHAALLGSCAELLGWDEETCMPRGGAAHRGRQMALLAGLHHERLTDPRVEEWLADVDGTPLVADPLSPEAVNVRELRRTYDRACQVPRALVEELAQITSLAQQEWAVARRRAEFARFLPWLTRIVNLKRREAESHGGDLYDALLEDYEPGARSKALARTFAQLREELGPLLAAIAGAHRRPNVGVLARRFPLQRQRTFVQRVAAAVGFDFAAGRLDRTTHPFFTSIGPGDCRIATRYALNQFEEAFFATLHEVGHGLYEQGLPAEHYGTPMGEAPSLGLHESQARLWENAVGRSRGFWQHFFPLARQAFPAALRNVTLDDFHFALHHVAPSRNRVRADEVTYNLHIGIRFELERALIHGDLRPEDLPGAWNEAYRRDLGIVPPDDAEGCLQDGHWAAGMIGYFPTYTIGNIFAAQLMEQARAEIGNPDEAFGRGEFGELLGWLRRRVHTQGSRHGALRLIEEITGKAARAGALVEALRQRYGPVYGLELGTKASRGA
jgi:carboxypeptidase Taq